MDVYQKLVKNEIAKWKGIEQSKFACTNKAIF